MPSHLGADLRNDNGNFASLNANVLGGAVHDSVREAIEEIDDRIDRDAEAYMTTTWVQLGALLW